MTMQRCMSVFNLAYCSIFDAIVVFVVVVVVVVVVLLWNA